MADEVCQRTVTGKDGQTHTCGQVHDPKKCTGHSSIREDDGKAWSGTTRPLLGIRPCRQPPLKGQKVCRMHGGKAKQNQAKAAERLAEEAEARAAARHAPDPAVAERRSEAIKMRRDGVRYEDIAAALGYNSRGAAVQDVQRALATMVSEPAEELRALELQRLDAMWQAALEVLVREHITVSNGKVVTLNGEPIKDDGPVLNAIDRLLRIQERRAKLLGLDAPAKHEVVTLDAIESEIRKLNDELARADELDRVEAGEAAGAETASG